MNNWIALKCEGCGSPLEPLARTGGLITIHGAPEEWMNELAQTLDIVAKEKRLGMPIISVPEPLTLIRSPLADLLKCTSCGMLYERNQDGN